MGDLWHLSDDLLILRNPTEAQMEPQQTPGTGTSQHKLGRARIWQNLTESYFFRVNGSHLWTGIQSVINQLRAKTELEDPSDPVVTSHKAAAMDRKTQLNMIDMPFSNSTRLWTFTISNALLYVDSVSFISYRDHFHPFYIY